MTETLTRVEKPWGYELWWARTDRYVGKVIHVNKGHALSLQYHNRKDETIFVWSGKILFERQEGEALVSRELVPGDAVHVTPPTVHRMTALEDSDIFEVSTPETDDVVRLEDRYGRQDWTELRAQVADRTATGQARRSTDIRPIRSEHRQNGDVVVGDRAGRLPHRVRCSRNRGRSPADRSLRPAPPPSRTILSALTSVV